MKGNKKYQLITFLIATVWLVNGLFCKALNLVPRHEEIVASILGDNNSRFWTVLIGIAEILMAGWIISGIWPRLNTVLQVIVIAAMNILEFILVPDLLLWGRINSVFAFLFVLLICYNGFCLGKKLAYQS
ncbi:DoxX-like family protein [Flavihumibacter solisilvae]|uniref:DoxX family protein n=1 Tax=Flavihumibacter solisilvae TaxID=1349421 RepID=A0A0C1ISZ7_9BACT|nr:DoxX-like family protein [Flavihumibacter solisilvae]KIC93534.1 hypothetical protein OI18_17450 [Flavihumibacter solisilvae]